jgi:hypothetical protein
LILPSRIPCTEIIALSFVGFVRPTCNRRGDTRRLRSLSCCNERRDSDDPEAGELFDGYRDIDLGQAEIDIASPVLRKPAVKARAIVPADASGLLGMTAILLHNVKQPNTYSNTQHNSFPRRIRARVLNL